MKNVGVGVSYIKWKLRRAIRATGKPREIMERLEAPQDLTRNWNNLTWTEFWWVSRYWGVWGSIPGIASLGRYSCWFSELWTSTPMASHQEDPGRCHSNGWKKIWRSPCYRTRIVSIQFGCETRLAWSYVHDNEKLIFLPQLQHQWWGQHSVEPIWWYRCYSYCLYEVLYGIQRCRLN